MYTTNVTQSLKRNTLRAVAVILIMVFLLAALPSSSLAATDPKCASTYTVKTGDSLSQIANKNGVSWLAIAEANNIKSPYIIYSGQKLCIPASSSTGSGSGGSTTSTFSTSKSGSDLTVTVSSFPAYSVYYVKVDDASKSGLNWYKVGVLRVDKDKTAKATFTLPSGIKNASSLNVCLKNVYTDGLVCADPTLSRAGDSKDSDTGGSDKDGSFSASFTSDNRLTIKASGYPGNSMFYVKVDKAGKTFEYTKIGMLRLNKQGSMTESFKLPKDYAKVQGVNVCLKNVVTDDVQCRRFNR